MPHVTLVINAALNESLLDGIGSIYAEHGHVFTFSVHHAHELEEERLDPEVVAADLRRADLVLLDLRGSGRGTALCAATLEHTDNAVVCLVGGSPELMNLVRLGNFRFKDMARGERQSSTKEVRVERIQKMMRWVERAGAVLPVGALRHIRNWNRATRYWNAGGAENIRNMLLFLGREYLELKLPAPPAPREFADCGIYDPLLDRWFDRAADHRAAAGHDPSRPTVGLLFYGGMHFGQSVAGARALAERLAPHCNILPVYASGMNNLAALKRYFLPGGAPAVDALVQLQWFRFSTFADEDAPAIQELLDRLDVPVFAGVPLFGREERIWRESAAGLSPVELMTTVILPEIDGMIDPLPTIALAERRHEATGQTLLRATALEDQTDLVARRIRRRLALRTLPAHKKRVAFIIYDNPPGEQSLGQAGYLDVFASLQKIVEAMREEGYRAEEVPDAAELLNRLTAAGALNDPRWLPDGAASCPSLSTEHCRRLLADLQCSGEITAVWGEAPGSVMVCGAGVIIPGLELGNVGIFVQPVRGTHQDPEMLTHDRALVPHHQYAAFYRWLDEDWRADAMVHVGTHGTLEFLPGKEAGLSCGCCPVELLGALPHFYLYHAGNPSEAVIARRRSLATLVNHASPPFEPSGLYDDYARLEALLAEHAEASGAPGREAILVSEINDLAESCNLGGLSLTALHAELGRMQLSLIPRGLHILDEEHSPEVLARSTLNILHQEPELCELLAAEEGLDYAGLCADGVPQAVREVRARLEETACGLIARSIRARRPEGPVELRPALERALEIAGRLDARGEIPALLHALDGGFTPPGIGGDPLRDPEVLPTGRNSYQFDPRLVPSEAACEQGRRIAEETLSRYRETTGSWPENVALILWGFETAKTRGETVGQILAYLGVRAVRNSVWDTRLEIIPADELGRPRVDVTVQMCGFFRDMFMNVVELISRACAMVSDLDEPDDINPVRRHTRENAERFAAEGLSPKLAAARIFGPAPGEYGSGVTTRLEAASWKNEEDLVETFMHDMHHLYAENIHGESRRDLYAGQLERVDLVSQIRDTADYELVDLDHYYEFAGSLSRSVEELRGEAPLQLITDTTGAEPRTETLKESLERGVRTRLLNPRWIEGMLEHDVHGAQKIGERVQNLLGFAATTHAVDDWVFSGITSRFAADPEMFARLKDNNRYATEEILRRLLESRQRGYWEASEEELALLEERYLELEGDIEEMTEECG